MSETTYVPEVCERQDCDEPVAWVIHWEDAGAPEPAFACQWHGTRPRARRLRRTRIEDYSVSEAGGSR